MKILFYSDVHIELRTGQTRLPWTPLYPLDLGPRLEPYVGRVGLTVLAGDIGTLRPCDGVTVLDYARQAAEYLGSPVVLVPGNHEYYRGGDFDEDRRALLSASVPGVTVLDRGVAVFGRLRVLGATMWSDYALLGLGHRGLAMQAAELGINDHRLIRRQGGAAPFLPADALAEHRLSRAWLAERLTEPHDGPTLVVTHHVPHPAAAHPAHGMTALTPAFVSDCGTLIAAAAASNTVAWIYGHNHWSQEVEVGGVKLLSAQLGYPREQSNWRSPGILAIED
jgi:calcineurin-like phosphoesterase family protein